MLYTSPQPRRCPIHSNPSVPSHRGTASIWDVIFRRYWSCRGIGGYCRALQSIAGYCRALQGIEENKWARVAGRREVSRGTKCTQVISLQSQIWSFAQNTFSHDLKHFFANTFSHDPKYFFAQSKNFFSWSKILFLMIKILFARSKIRFCTIQNTCLHNSKCVFSQSKIPFSHNPKYLFSQFRIILIRIPDTFFSQSKDSFFRSKILDHIIKQTFVNFAIKSCFKLMVFSMPIIIYPAVDWMTPKSKSRWKANTPINLEILNSWNTYSIGLKCTQARPGGCTQEVIKFIEAKTQLAQTKLSPIVQLSQALLPFVWWLPFGSSV